MNGRGRGMNGHRAVHSYDRSEERYRDIHSDLQRSDPFGDRRGGFARSDQSRDRPSGYVLSDRKGERYVNFSQSDRSGDRHVDSPRRDRSGDIYRDSHRYDRPGDRGGYGGFERYENRHYDLERPYWPGNRDKQYGVQQYYQSEKRQYERDQREYVPSPKRHATTSYVPSGRSQDAAFVTEERSEPIYYTIPTPSTTRSSVDSQNQDQKYQPAHEQPQNQWQLTHRETPSTKRGAAENGRARVRKPDLSPEERIISNIITTRPNTLTSKLGKSGVKVSLITNYYPLSNNQSWQINQYRVDFAPEIEIIPLKRRLIKEQIGGFGTYLFVGSMLFLKTKLPKDIMKFMSKDRDNNPIEITVKFVGLLPKIQSNYILTAILRQSLAALQMQQVGRNYYDATAKVYVRELNLELWPGYITTIRHYEHEVLMLAEISYKVMRRDTVYHILQKHLRTNRSDFKRSFENEVLGMTVLTMYNNKCYRIDEVDYTNNPSTTFTRKSGEISYVDYYSQKYNLRINDVGQPLLIHKSSERDLRGGMPQLIALVPELCRATGLSEEMRSNQQLMRTLANSMSSKPIDRLNKLKSLNRRLQENVDSMENLKKWGLGLGQELVKVGGRRLPRESILFKVKAVKTDHTVNWTKDFRNNEMYVSQHLKNWVLTYPHENDREVKNFVRTLQQAARGMKYEISTPHFQAIDDKAIEYPRELSAAANRDPQLIMCILKNAAVDRYSLIKKQCFVILGIPNQVVLLSKIRSGGSLMSIATKILIQLNCKVGGVPWMLDIPHSGLMVVGFDVYHDTKDKRKSYGAMVATMHVKHTKPQYFSAVSPHKDGQDISSDIALNASKALNTLAKAYGKLPAEIVWFRDGISEGHTEYLLNVEVKSIRDVLKLAYGGEHFKLTFIVVSKKINTRFFENRGNPHPGTVVDDVVTLAEKFDFLMVSQLARQGTASPTSYNVVYTNSDFTPDAIQVLTYQMTHLYYNWSGTLRVPSVCQYAHKLAFLVGNFIHDAPLNKLENQLYFL